MSDPQSYDLAVIGAGPGGYVAAIRAAQLGMRTALVEKEAKLGGTCLRVGCIPSKALLESSELYHAARHSYADHGIEIGEVGLDLDRMMARKVKIVDELTSGIQLLMKKNKVTVHRGTGRLLGEGRVAVTGEDGSETEFGAARIVLASGSAPVELGHLPFDGERIVGSTEALSFPAVPEHLIVVGAGAIGLEMGSVWARLGAKVTVVEMMPRIVPPADSAMTKLLLRLLKKQGLEFLLETKVTGAKVEGERVRVTVEDSQDQESELVGDRLLVAVGRRPYTDGLGLDAAGVTVDPRGRIPVDENYATNVTGIYAIGDLLDGPMLAHKASEEAVVCVERIAGHPVSLNYRAIPNIVYTWPELAEVGLSEDAAKEQGLDYKVGKYTFRANGRAKTLGEVEGQVKVLSHAQTDQLLGVHIVGARASDLIAEVVTAIEFAGSAEDVGRIVHAHPTLSEIVKEAALAAYDQPIHG